MFQAYWENFAGLQDTREFMEGSTLHIAQATGFRIVLSKKNQNTSLKALAGHSEHDLLPLGCDELCVGGNFIMLGLWRLLVGHRAHILKLSGEASDLNTGAKPRGARHRNEAFAESVASSVCHVGCISLQVSHDSAAIHAWNMSWTVQLPLEVFSTLIQGATDSKTVVARNRHVRLLSHQTVSFHHLRREPQQSSGPNGRCRASRLSRCTF